MYNNNTNNSIPNTENVVACFDMSGLSRIDEKFHDYLLKTDPDVARARKLCEEVDKLLLEVKELLSQPDDENYNIVDSEENI